MSSIQSLPSDIWFQICLQLSIKSLCTLRATCKDIHQLINERSVWFSALLDLLRVKPSVHTIEDIEQMSAVQLREASVRLVKVDMAFTSATLPHRKIKLLPDLETSKVTEVTLLPGGDRLLVLRINGSFGIYHVSTGKVVSSIPRVEGMPVNSASARIFPSSLFTGHIVVHASVVLEDWDLISTAELRVYKYTNRHIRHVGTEQCAELPSSRDCIYTLCDRQGSLRLLQLPFKDDMQRLLVVDVHIRTLGASDDDYREIRRFTIDTLFDPELPIFGWDSQFQLLSSRYLLCAVEEGLRIFDMAQSCKDGSANLEPIWKSPEEYGAIGVLSTPSMRSTIDGETFVRLFLESQDERYILAMPAYGDIWNTNAIRLIPISLPIITSSLSSVFYGTAEELFADVHHGLAVYTGLQQVRPKTSAPPLPVEARRLCPFALTTDTMTAHDDHGAIRGFMRLGKHEADRNRVQLGTMSDWQAHVTRIERKFSIDDVSGRFVQHTRYRVGGHKPTIDLYAFDL